MNSSYQAPLYLIPFDHRYCYVAGMFQFTPPLATEQQRAVVDGTHAISEGFQRALDNEVPLNRAALTSGAQLGTCNARDAVRKGDVTTLSTEKNGSQHIEAFQPTFARILLRYNPEDDAALRKRQTMRLKQLSDYCRAVGQPFMFELLVPAKRIRENLTVETIRVIQDPAVDPDTWKVEVFDCREDGERDGRGAIGSSVLRRGADASEVGYLLKPAAAVSRFVGFAVGRMTFWGAVTDFMEARGTREEAVPGIRGWVAVSEREQTR